MKVKSDSILVSLSSKCYFIHCKIFCNNSFYQSPEKSSQSFLSYKFIQNIAVFASSPLCRGPNSAQNESVRRGPNSAQKDNARRKPNAAQNESVEEKRWFSVQRF